MADFNGQYQVSAYDLDDPPGGTRALVWYSKKFSGLEKDEAVKMLQEERRKAPHLLIVLWEEQSDGEWRVVDPAQLDIYRVYAANDKGVPAYYGRSFWGEAQIKEQLAKRQKRFPAAKCGVEKLGGDLFWREFPLE